MTREEIKEILPIMQAFAEGKTIEYMGINGQWVETAQPVWGGSKLRIKPEPKYRPFDNQEECWNEMLKHQPFGWIKNNSDYIFNILVMLNNTIKLNECCNNYSELFKGYKFIDGTPFGIRED